MRGSTSVGYDQFETSPEAIEQELRPAVCERRPTDRLKANYSIDDYKITDQTDLPANCIEKHLWISSNVFENKIRVFGELRDKDLLPTGCEKQSLLSTSSSIM